MGHSDDTTGYILTAADLRLLEFAELALTDHIAIDQPARRRTAARLSALLARAERRRILTLDPDTAPES